MLRPGEISLAHHGVLFFDELSEFNCSTIESLCQPMEDRRIALARPTDRMYFPTNIILIATATFCPYAYYALTDLRAAMATKDGKVITQHNCKSDQHLILLAVGHAALLIEAIRANHGPNQPE